MKTLGVDYGRKKIGLAISEGMLAEPWKVVKVNDFEETIEKTLQILKELRVDKVVVGVSEGEMGKESKRFAKRIEQKFLMRRFPPILLKSFQGGKSGKKEKKNLEDAYAASVMLQSYLDNYV